MADTRLLPATEMTDRELVDLAMESHTNYVLHAGGEIRDRANECRAEILRRLALVSPANQDQKLEEDAGLSRPTAVIPKDNSLKADPSDLHWMLGILQASDTSSNPAAKMGFYGGWNSAIEYLTQAVRERITAQITQAAETGAAPASTEEYVRGVEDAVRILEEHHFMAGCTCLSQAVVVNSIRSLLPTDSPVEDSGEEDRLVR